METEQMPSTHESNIMTNQEILKILYKQLKSLAYYSATSGGQGYPENTNAMCNLVNTIIQLHRLEEN